MEIEWAIIAKDCQLNEDKTLDIYGVIDDFVIRGEYGLALFYLILRLRFNPIESDERQMINLEISHNKKGVVKTVDTPYHVPNWDTTINRITYLISTLRAVKIEYEGRNIWTVQDAYFDETLVDTHGNPYDFFDLLRVLKKRKHNLVKTKIGSSGKHDMFVAPELVPKIKESGFSWYFYDLAEIPEPVKILPDGRYKYKVKPRMKNLLKHPTSGVPLLKWLESEGYPPDMLYFYLNTFAIYGPDSSAADREALLDSIKSVINSKLQ